MKKFDNFLLFNYIIYISVFILIFILGISGVFAASYTGSDYTAQLYDNVNGNLTSVTTSGPYNGGLYEGYIAYAANSSGGAWGISSPITLLANHTYTLTASIPNECGNLVLSTYNRIGVGTTLSNAKTSYQNNTNVNEIYSKVIGGDNFLIQFAFIPSINGSYIVFPYSTTSSCGSSRTILESISIEDLGAESLTEQEINNALNTQTNEINNSINNMGEDIKDSINDNFNSCHDSVNLINFNNVIKSNSNVEYEILSTGIRVYNTTAGTYRNVYIDTDILESGTYTLHKDINVNSGVAYILIQSVDGSTQNIINTSNSGSTTFSIETNSIIRIVLYSTRSANETGDVSYTNLQLQKGSVFTKYEPYGEEICSNKIDETNDKLDETNQQLGDLNNSLNDSNSSGATDDASNFFSNFTTDTFGLTSIITAPLSLINTITSSSCSSLRLPLPYLDNKYLELPCMNTIYTEYFGSFFNIYQTITFGIIAYWVIVRIFNQVKDFKNPDHDEIEVLDL